MRSFVTGANGFVGAHLVRALLAEGHKVQGLVRQQSNLKGLSQLPINLSVGDVLDKNSLLGAMKDCDVLFHTAAHFVYSGDRLKTLNRLALEGTANVIEAAKASGIQRIVLTSSSVVCGSSFRPKPRDETACLEADETTPYILSKLKQEQLATELAQAYGIELVCACPTLVIGSEDWRLGPSNGLILAYLKDAFRTTFPGGCNMVCVEDIAKAHLLLAEKGKSGERYLLGGENISWQQLHQSISNLCGIKGPIWTANHTFSYLVGAMSEILSQLTGQEPLTSRAQAAMLGRYYWYDHSKASAIGYSPKSTFQALAKAIAWLSGSAHVSRKVRMQLRLSREVFSAMADNQRVAEVQ